MRRQCPRRPNQWRPWRFAFALPFSLNRSLERIKIGAFDIFAILCVLDRFFMAPSESGQVKSAQMDLITRPPKVVSEFFMRSDPCRYYPRIIPRISLVWLAQFLGTVHVLSVGGHLGKIPNGSQQDKGTFSGPIRKSKTRSLLLRAPVGAG